MGLRESCIHGQYLSKFVWGLLLLILSSVFGCLSLRFSQLLFFGGCWLLHFGGFALCLLAAFYFFEVFVVRQFLAAAGHAIHDAVLMVGGRTHC